MSSVTFLFFFPRFLTGEFVGAEIIVVESKDNVKLKGERGIVISNTANCFVIAVRAKKESIVTEKHDSAGSKTEQMRDLGDNSIREKPLDTRTKLRRVVKDNCILAVPLPSMRGQGKSSPIEQIDDIDADAASSDRQGVASSVTLTEHGKVCLLYGIRWLPQVSSLSSDAFADNSGGKNDEGSTSGSKKQRR